METATPTPSPSSRLGFIDVLRGWAVLVMIETHVVNALLCPEIKDESFFKLLTFVNGLVAPSFLFCAGMGMAISLQKKWDDYVDLRMPLWRSVARLLFIAAVGYSLHLPFFSLSRLRELADGNAWIPFFQVDILQTIVVSLLFLTLIAVIVRKEQYFLWIAALSTAAIVFASPIIREMDYSGLPVWFRPYLTTQFKSQFPLFPWTAFLTSGTVVCFLYLRMRAQGKEGVFMKRLLVFSVCCMALSLLAEFQPVTLYPRHDFWRASPEFFFLRLGLVTMFLWLIWRAKTSWSPLMLFGQESLIVYTVHLLIVYGYTYEWSFIRYFGPHLDYAQSLGLTLILAAAMYVLAFIWHFIKQWNIGYAKILQFATLSGIVVMFIVKTS